MRARPIGPVAAAGALAATAVLAVAVPPAAGRAPAVSHMVVFRDGEATARRLTARATKVRVRSKRCAVGEGTALAALVRSRPGRIALRDFGACSSRPRNAAGLFVSGIRGDNNRGQNGWVYKVGRRAATAGAADPSGPFGRGRLRTGQRITWFYCLHGSMGCQHTLEAVPRATEGGAVVTVRGYDDDGVGVRVAGATVIAGGRTVTTGPDGTARLDLVAGRHRVTAAKAGLVRSFAEFVRVP